MLSIRERVDPGNALPQISFSELTSRMYGGRTISTLEILLGAKTVGRTYRAEDKADREVWLGHLALEIPDSGDIAMATHLVAMESAHEDGNTYRTDPVLLREIDESIWRRFTDAGVGEIVEPFGHSLTLGRNTTEVMLYDGHVRIPPMNGGEVGIPPDNILTHV